MCRPDTDDACEADLDATVIDADGSTRVEPFTAAADAPIDCFYVYPTVSNDAGANSDLQADVQERNVVVQQAARLAAVCDLYAPVYRQFTLPELARWFSGESEFGNGRELAYADVLDAWRHYLANDNDGRGVIIVGHSQGAMHLSTLLKEEIDPDERQRSLLVSAVLIGNSVHEGDFPNVHACSAAGGTGCVISYSSFRSTSPPPADTYFARPGTDGEEAICTNPASLAGGSAELHPYFGAGAAGVDVTTPFVTMPGLVTAECVTTDGFHHLSLTVHGDPATPRADDIGGDLAPQWGMHLVDVNVAMGDLVEVARSQAAAYTSAHG